MPMMVAAMDMRDSAQSACELKGWTAAVTSALPPGTSLVVPLHQQTAEVIAEDVTLTVAWLRKRAGR